MALYEEEKDGQFETYHPDGSLCSIGTLKNGKYHGKGYCRSAAENSGRDRKENTMVVPGDHSCSRSGTVADETAGESRLVFPGHPVYLHTGHSLCIGLWQLHGQRCVRIVYFG